MKINKKTEFFQANLFKSVSIKNMSKVVYVFEKRKLQCGEILFK